MARTTKKERKPVTPEAMLVNLHKEVANLTHATLVLAKRIVKLESAENKRVIHGFADAESSREIEVAKEVEDIEENGDVVG
jgi:hypothetical protein